MSKIEVKNIYKIFGKQPEKWLDAVKRGMSKEELLTQSQHTLGLKDISLNIEEGSIYVIMGLSGSGKSTLIRHFNRLIEPTAGQILVDGTDVMKLGKKELEKFRQKTMSMVFQRFGLLPHKTTLENAAYGLIIQGVDKDKAQETARYWLEQVGLAGFENQYPSQLSGGMQQRVGLARALATDAEILLMDEAFSALDPLIRREMQNQLLELQSRLNKTIVFITHDLDEALRLGNRIAILKDGELIQEGTPEDILLSPNNEYVEAFLQDVNRSKILNAGHAVNQTRLTLSMRTRPTLALERMKQYDYQFAPVLDGNLIAGILHFSDAEQAVRSGLRDISSLVKDIISVPASTGLDAVLTHMLQSDQPLAVTDENDEFIGMMSRTKVVELVTTDNANTENGNDAGSTPENPDSNSNTDGTSDTNSHADDQDKSA
ncbi:MAG: glycine betaine/L-proline ABC transporter ATP-binding protein [Alcaligenaceae bacterium]|jgi:glycine betaine/proline transport system ATP-binding protein|uniref:quaternary amine ABC transporter ATP-binding protein n=1 Tax=Advenella sp. EE-W14 TaxID=2722705 RepID=UPI00145C566C|nr:glycine betaine/L-proline ABC transporter ATP-binding protein [Advenella sp. EE-W14]NLN66543.1 glycine betaine/L-proline ABC transporter ATP-binding protein [Alcaligenaceae bacterium]